ncbi:hypothetical protein [Pisciglobus halotolerans]|uniref:hypothetical protein n=1 Tax=Pisciglobus halotolerans TaxID=745365 RepID=UPI000B84E065|nr:hypothetical protein [Pisciglobus halotolerans]
MFDLEKVIKTIEAVGGYQVFGTDMKKDEVDSNESFFIYYDKGPITKADGSNQYLRDFILMFITKENAEIDEFGLILALQKCRLRFDNTEYDYGRIADTEREARMTTFNFHQALVVC